MPRVGYAMEADFRAIAIGARWCGSGPRAALPAGALTSATNDPRCGCNPGSASDAAGAASCADCETVGVALGFADWTAPGQDAAACLALRLGGVGDVLSPPTETFRGWWRRTRDTTDGEQQ